MTAPFALLSATLRVANLARSRDFYGRVLGLDSTPGPAPASLELRAAGAKAGEPPLLVLVATPETVPKPPTAPGLFHLALLVPHRAALARVVLRLASSGHPLQGASDHGVSEALYLEDPDGNGIELYADRAPEAWPYRDGRLALSTEPLDFDALLATAPDRNPAGLPARTCIGHVHLRAGSLAAVQDFYTRELGLVVRARYGPSAVFLAADGYHHHVGINTWGGAATSRSDRHAGLVALTVAQAGLTAPRQLTDPDGLQVTLVPRSP